MLQQTDIGKLPLHKDKDIGILAQMQDRCHGKLSAVIVRDGETKLNYSTTEGFGIVSGRVFSWR